MGLPLAFPLFRVPWMGSVGACGYDLVIFRISGPGHRTFGDRGALELRTFELWNQPFRSGMVVLAWRVCPNKPVALLQLLCSKPL